MSAFSASPLTPFHRSPLAEPAFIKAERRRARQGTQCLGKEQTAISAERYNTWSNVTNPLQWHRPYKWGKLAQPDRKLQPRPRCCTNYPSADPSCRAKSLRHMPDIPLHPRNRCDWPLAPPPFHPGYIRRRSLHRDVNKESASSCLRLRRCDRRLSCLRCIRICRSESGCALPCEPRYWKGASCNVLLPNLRGQWRLADVQIRAIFLRLLSNTRLVTVSQNGHCPPRHRG
jgi:hypothetical protein